MLLSDPQLQTFKKIYEDHHPNDVQILHTYNTMLGIDLVDALGNPAVRFSLLPTLAESGQFGRENLLELDNLVMNVAETGMRTLLASSIPGMAQYKKVLQD